MIQWDIPTFSMNFQQFLTQPAIKSYLIKLLFYQIPYRTSIYRYLTLSLYPCPLTHVRRGSDNNQPKQHCYSQIQIAWPVNLISYHVQRNYFEHGRMHINLKPYQPYTHPATYSCTYTSIPTLAYFPRDSI